jgi:hypothetical protein
MGSNPIPSVKYFCSKWLRLAEFRGNANGLGACVTFIRFAAIPRVCLLRLIPRYQCAAFCATRCTVVMIRSCLCVMLQAHLGVVSHPQSDNVDWERFKQFGFAARPQVVEQPWPRFQPGPLDQLFKRGAQIAIPPTGGALGFGQVVPADDVRLAGFGEFKRFFEKRSQFREQRNRPACLAVVAIGFGTGDRHAATVPIDVSQFQGQNLGRATQATITAQGDDDAPGRIRNVQQPFHGVAANEPLPGAHVGRRNLHFRERVLVNQFVLAGHMQERPGERKPFGHGCKGQVLRQEPCLELVAIAGRDAS